MRPISKNLKRMLGIAFPLLLLSGACSRHLRTADSSVSGPEIVQMLSDAQTSSSPSETAEALANAVNLSNQAGIAIFYAGTPEMGNVVTVMGLRTFAFLNLPQNNIYSFAAARVFFIERTSDHTAALVLGLQGNSSPGQYSYYAFTGTGVINKGLYSFDFAGLDGSKLSLQSADLQGSSLNPSIQMQLYQGTEEIGKFSTLTRYQ